MAKVFFCPHFVLTYEIKDVSETISDRFQNLLIKVSEKTKQRCVVLIDEYDKPLLELVDDPERQEHNKLVFKGFFSNLKSCDAYIRFVFITGVTKFHKVSIFSDLNQLNDISLSDDFAGICGITEEEMVRDFEPEIKALSEKQKSEHSECLNTLKQEVKYGFLNSILPTYIPAATEVNGLDIFSIEDYIANGNLDRIKDFLTALFAQIPYTTNDAPFEHYFQSIIYIVFTLLGQYTVCEMQTFNGRIDGKVETDRFIYLFEFKRDKSAENALQQINDKNYALAFIAEQKNVIRSVCLLIPKREFYPNGK